MSDIEEPPGGEEPKQPTIDLGDLANPWKPLTDLGMPLEYAKQCVRDMLYLNALGEGMDGKFPDTPPQLYEGQEQAEYVQRWTATRNYQFALAAAQEIEEGKASSPTAQRFIESRTQQPQQPSDAYPQPSPAGQYQQYGVGAVLRPALTPMRMDDFSLDPNLFGVSSPFCGIRLPKNSVGFRTGWWMMGIHQRQNIRANRPEMLIVRDELQPGGGHGWIPIKKSDKGCLRIWFSEHFLDTNGSPWSVPIGTWNDLFDELFASAEEDPMRTYLMELSEWDKVPRLDTMFSSLWELQDNERNISLAKWAAMSILGGAVNRTMMPGCQHDEIVVLYGGQGLGKSSVLEHLVPYPAMYGSSLRLDSDDGRRLEATLGKVLVETSEMSGSGRAAVDALKAWVSIRSDYYRLAYREGPEDIPRRWVCIGTTNDKHSLPNDPTGNRRFPVIELADVPIEQRVWAKSNAVKWVLQHRDQLWAEAYHRAWVRSEPVWLHTAALQISAGVASESHRYKDELMEDAVAELPKQPTKMRDIADACKLFKDEGDKVLDLGLQSRLKKALVQAGWSPKRKGSDRRELWYPPDFVPSAAETFAGKLRNVEEAMSLDQLCEIAGIETDELVTKKVLSEELKKAGWRSVRVKQIDGSRPRLWEPPQAVEQGSSSALLQVEQDYDEPPMEDWIPPEEQF